MAVNTMKLRIQFRRDHTANWELHKDIVPAAGEPCFDIDLGTLKIGDGVKTYGELTTIGGATLSADGKSIVLEDNVFKLAGFDAAAVGAQLRKSENGLEWVVSTVDVEELQTIVTDLQTDVYNLQEIVTPSADDSVPLLTRIETLETKMDGTGEGSVDEKIDAKIEAFASSLTDDGKVNTLMELISYVESHGEEAADMASDIKTLQELVGATSVSDQIITAIISSEKKAEVIFENVKYEISSKPVGTLVDYRDKEIRVMCPTDTQWTLQTSGANADANAYYIGVKAYAPDSAVSFKEDIAEIITDNTMYYFEGNDFDGVDTYGRKYSIVWLPVAKYDPDADSWTYYGANSSKEHYVGWYYSVEWYDADGKKISSDCIRINLSNETCHTTIEPYYMADVIKEIAVNGTPIDVVNGRVNIAIEEAVNVKASEEITIAEDGTLGIGKISFSKITQDENETVIMDGGSATG